MAVGAPPSYGGEPANTVEAPPVPVEAAPRCGECPPMLENSSTTSLTIRDVGS
jgi:hypothetical protein